LVNSRQDYTAFSAAKVVYEKIAVLKRELGTFSKGKLNRLTHQNFSIKRLFLSGRNISRLAIF
jgi:hypothetical protein